MSITYPINALPRAIPLCLGVQSEYGARPISIDVSEWVGRWPDIIVSVQPVRPGEDVSYLAAGVTRSGNIVTWTPNAYDTEIPGTGSVEIIGLADGVKIIRTGAATSIAPTKSSVSKTPEDPIAAWADSVIRAGEQAKSSAEEALLLAQAANKSANNANASAVQAQSAHRAAANAASQAATYRTDAVNAMNAAKNSQTQANTSERNASAAAAAAYKSQTKAEAAAKRAEDAANSMGGGTVSPGDGKLKADAIMCDKSGEVVSIADASEMDALSVVSRIDSPEGVTEITLTRTGKNIWGGMALAQSIASQVDGAVLDVDAKTVTYDAGKIKAVNVFDKFEQGKRYTVIFARDESKSKGTTANIRIIYDTGEALNISFNSGNSAVVTTAANKNVEKLLGYNSSGPTCLLYEQCGVFEGVLTAEDFVPSEAETFTVTLPEAVTDGTFEWATGVLTINQDGTSRTVQLDAQPIAMLDGYNTLWSSTGQTDVRYVADTKAYVDGHGADADAEYADNAGYAENAGYADNAGHAEEAGDAQTVKGRDIAAEVDAISEEIAEIKNTDIPDYWENAVESAIRKVENYQDKGGVDVCTFGFITDTHTDVNNSGVFARLMGRVMDACKIPMCMHGGDYIAGSAIISKENLIKQHAHNDYIFRNIEDRLLTAQGNHESVYGVTENYDSNLTNSEIYNYVFRKNQGKFGMVYGDTGTYFYKDIPAQKVRYIVLNCYEFETEMDNNQVVISNNKLRTSKFGVAQLAWLANTALDVPEGYSVVICSHNAPYRRTDVPQAWLSETTFMIDCEVTLGIINAYRNKTSYTYTGTLGTGTTLENYSLSFDFTQRKGELVCWVAGHTHMDGIFDIEGLKVVVTANCSRHIAVTDAPEKVPGTDTEYIMDFFCINKKTRECNVVRLGATLEKGDDGEIVVVNNKADTDSDDWINNKRINLSKELVDGDGYAVSNFVPFAFGSTINLAGFGVMSNHTNLVFYKADTTTVFKVVSYNDAHAYMFSISDNVISFDSSAMRNPGTEWNEAVYFRVSAPLSGTLDDVAITVNEPIHFEPYGKPEGVRVFSY